MMRFKLKRVSFSLKRREEEVDTSLGVMFKLLLLLFGASEVCDRNRDMSRTRGAQA